MEALPDMAIERRDLILKWALSLIFLFAFWPLQVASANSNSAQNSDGKSPALRVMTYNIRLDTDADGTNKWAFRREWLSAQIHWLHPDIFGLQEVLLNQKQDIAADLPNYNVIGVGRDDGNDGGESSPIGYNRWKFKLLGSGTFWLSPTPALPSRGWDAAYPRIASWVRLRSKRDNNSILVVNTHWDHVGVQARAHSAEQLRNWLGAHKRKGVNIIVLGDFNTSIDSEAMQILTNGNAKVLLRDSRAISQRTPFGSTGTFNDFKLQSDSAKSIDHILVGNTFSVRRHAVIAQNVDGRMISDHYPVLADLEIEK